MPWWRTFCGEKFLLDDEYFQRFLVYIESRDRGQGRAVDKTNKFVFEG
jgi:hypothetical protein